MVRHQEKKERIARQRKDQILSAALTVFVRKGFGEATLPDIAHEAGIAVGTIYNYYQSKRDLLVSVVTKYIITETFLGLIEHPPEADDAAFLSSIIENRVDFGFNSLDRYLLLVSEVLRNKELRQQYAEQVLWPALELVQRYLESRTASGAFRPLNARVVSRAIGGMLFGFMLFYQLEGERSSLSKIPRQQLVAELTNLLLNGLKSR